jgi:hypothetical protein
MVEVIFRQNLSRPPFPCVEGVFCGHITQPYVHDILYECTVGEDTRFYRIYFKRHIGLPINLTLLRFTKLLVTGDVAVLRANAQGEVVGTHMDRTDAFRANLIVTE